MTIDQSDFQSASRTTYTTGETVFQWNEGIQAPQQVNFETLSDGNILAVWAVDNWKDQGN